MKRTFAGAGMILMTIFAYGQEPCRITGRVFETLMAGNDGKTETEYPLDRATIKVASAGDSLAVTSSPGGFFSFENLPQGQISITATKQEYLPYKDILDIVPGDNIVIIRLERKPTELAGAVITADVPAVSFHKDTVVFNASAVRLMDGENAVEILRQMPGVEVAGGKVIIHGKEVKRTYVNGALIYGNDVMAPLNALLAENVISIKSYDEMSVVDRRRRARHGKKEKVLDITTKEAIKTAFDGHISAGIGTEDSFSDAKYTAGAVANFFSEKFLSYANVYTDNIGVTDNSFHPNGFFPGRLTSDNDRISVNGGIHKFWGDRLMGNDLRIDYRYNRERADYQSVQKKDYFENDIFTRHYEQQTGNSSTTNSHQAALYCNINNDFIKSVSIAQRFSFDDSDRNALEKELARIWGNTPKTRNETHSEVFRRWSVAGDFVWADNQNPKGWFPTVSIGYNIGNKWGNEARIDTLSSSFAKRFLTFDNRGFSYEVQGKAMCAFLLTNSEKATATLTAGYGFNRKNNQQKQLAINALDADNPITDPINSYDFSWNVFEHGGMVLFQYSAGEFSADIDGQINFSSLMDNESVPGKTSFRKFFITPGASAYIKYRHSSISYNLNPVLPSTEQLRERLDNSNPLFLRSGNSGLKPALVHTLTLNHIIPKAGKNGSLRLAFDFMAVRNNIVTRTSYYPESVHMEKWGGYDIPSGANLQAWDNAGGTLTGTLSANYSIRLQKIKSTLTTSAGLTLATRGEYIADKLTHRSELVPQIKGMFTFRPDNNTRITLSSSLSLVDSRSFLYRMKTILPSISADATRVFGKHFFIRGNYSYAGNCYLKDGIDNIHLHGLNALAGLKFMKGGLVVSLSVNDLLGKDNDYSITKNADSIVQSWLPTFGRYYMLTVSYRLNRTKPDLQFRGGLVNGSN